MSVLKHCSGLDRILKRRSNLGAIHLRARQWFCKNAGEWISIRPNVRLYGTDEWESRKTWIKTIIDTHTHNEMDAKMGWKRSKRVMLREGLQARPGKVQGFTAGDCGDQSDWSRWLNLVGWGQDRPRYSSSQALCHMTSRGQLLFKRVMQIKHWFL